MLQLQTIAPRTLVLLKELQAIDELSQTLLVGGTALALQLGHRSSIDLDIFGIIEMESITSVLESRFDDIVTINNSKNIKQYTIDDIKVDIVNYTYPWIKPPIVVDGVSLASMEDIAAMKINAITGRGSKKDFIDLYFLLKHFSMVQILEFYSIKYPKAELMMVYKSLSYFLDAEPQTMPTMFNDVSWEKIKKHIQIEVEKL